MTGAEHYAEAQRLLDGPWEGIEDWDGARRDNLAAAQVHATLALAAASGANRCANRDSFDGRCQLEAGHDGLHSVPLQAEKAWSA